MASPSCFFNSIALQKGFVNERKMKLKRKYYLIDTENVGDRWFDLLQKIEKKDQVITFYTENHSKRLKEYLLTQVHNPRILWLECATGNNALDYQLIGVLAYLIAKHPKASFCIYSNDKDYWNTVDFWQSRGIDVRQKGFEEVSKKKEKKKKEKEKGKEKQRGQEQKQGKGKQGERQKAGKDRQASQRKAGKDRLAGQQKAGKDRLAGQQKAGKDRLAGQQKAAKDRLTGQQKSGTDRHVDQKARGKAQSSMQGILSTPSKMSLQMPRRGKLTEEQYVREIAKSVPLSDLGSWYQTLTAILGQEAGRNWYLKIKDDAGLRDSLSRYYMRDVHLRGVNLVAAVLNLHDLDVSRAEEAYKIIQSHSRKNLKAMREDFDKQFGKKPPQKYFKVLRSIIRVIKGKGFQ